MIGWVLGGAYELLRFCSYTYGLMMIYSLNTESMSSDSMIQMESSRNLLDKFTEAQD